MKKCIITSSIMKKAHAATRRIKEEYPEVNYRYQLSLEIKRLIAEEKQYCQDVKLRIQAQKWINKYITSEYPSPEEKIMLADMMYIDLGIKRFGYTTQLRTRFDIARELVHRYPINVGLRCVI
jgi:hypothetical protein